ncbi:MAG: transposase [Gracilimonas sp.]|uniref:REP-associated tyrosine transposase n=1 Tax=Gracilimonas sp. TaxID=1974203 RepID=UPI001991ACAD|nr:transposase [Gracilimonas sp.]MBD3616949.1 transposase [Gracilimonas sp.]
MGRTRYKFYEKHYPYFITSTILEELPILSKPQIAQIVLDQLVYLQQRREVTLYAYILMGNHFHAIVQGEELAKKLRLGKSYTARQILDVLKQNGHTHWLEKLKWNKRSHKIGRTFQVWQEGLHPKQLTNMKMVNQKIEYIHVNPVRAGFVKEPAHWRYSSACDYLGVQGLIPVTVFGG